MKPLTIIKKINPKKTSDFDLIIAGFMKELRGYFPSRWKMGQIVLIQKIKKPTNKDTFYRPISLLPTLSKLIGKSFLAKLELILEVLVLILEHQDFAKIVPLLNKYVE